MRRRAAIVLIGIVLACAAAAGPAHAQRGGRPDVAQAVSEMATTTDYQVRNRLYQSIVQVVTVRDLPAVEAAFGKITLQTYSVASQFVTLLERMQHPRADAVIQQQLNHPIVGTRLYIAYALERRNDRSWVPKLLAALADESLDPGQRSVLVSAFRYTTVEEALLDRLAAVAADPARHETVVVRILSTLAEKPRARFEPLYTTLAAGDRPAKVRGAAYSGLIGLGHLSKLDELWEAYDAGELTDNDLYQTMLYLQLEVNDRVLEFCTNVLRRAKQASLINKISALLGASGDRRAVPILKRLVNEQHGSVRIAAMDALSKLGAPDLVDYWRKVLEAADALGDDDAYVLQGRVKAAVALLNLDDRSGIPVLVTLAAHANLTVRRAAMQALSASPDRAAMPVAIDRLTDDDQTTRMYAWNTVNAVMRAFFPYRPLDTASLEYSYSSLPNKRPQVQQTLRDWWRTRGKR